MIDGSSLLLGLSGLLVDHVQIGADGARDVRVFTVPELVGLCPLCGVRSSRSKGWVVTHPRDVQVGPDTPNLLWCKQRWVCRNDRCERRTFTDSVPEIPPRARFTGRVRSQMAEAVLDDGRTVKSAAAAHGASWNTCHNAVVALADPILGVEPDPVVVLGIDETRRGRAKWETDQVSGVRRWVDRFDTGFVDITGKQGLLAQVNGRDSSVVVAWLDERGQVFKDAITHVTIDMSGSYAKAIREALPAAEIVADRFHVVRLANEMVDEVRRRTTQDLRGRRGRKSDPEWISRRRLLRAAENLTVEQRQKLLDKLLDLDLNGDVAAAWIAKELLRDVLACKDNGGLRYEIWSRLDKFYTFAAACSVPEIHRLATTVDVWQKPIVTAIVTDLSNARSEGENRIVKHVGRDAFGFRNQTNQRRRVRWACTRQTRPVSSRVRRLRPC